MKRYFRVLFSIFYFALFILECDFFYGDIPLQPYDYKHFILYTFLIK